MCWFFQRGQTAEKTVDQLLHLCFLFPFPSTSCHYAYAKTTKTTPQYFIAVAYFKTYKGAQIKRVISGWITPTYLEPGRGHRALSVAVIQWDDGDDILSVRLQSGQSVKLTVTRNFHSLNISAFVNRKARKRLIFVQLWRDSVESVCDV